MLRGARRSAQDNGFTGGHNVPRTGGLTAACENTDTLFPLDGHLDCHQGHDVKGHSAAGIGRARVAQRSLGQTDIRRCVPFLTNRDSAS
ncbi:hypothetical protein DLM85_09340 [Hymenobacter edaphi]|uniref:Uncharacterized protein n=2 Tax=Hymenobacter edaphi TaxID=2211146 RepID=A0A328BNF7_9BACT|nr:hypothetical protein DLM85_09340 [Hymenobacter edaphi]